MNNKDKDNKAGYWQIEYTIFFERQGDKNSVPRTQKLYYPSSPSAEELWKEAHAAGERLTFDLSIFPEEAGTYVPIRIAQRVYVDAGDVLRPAVKVPESTLVKVELDLGPYKPSEYPTGTADK